MPFKTFIIFVFCLVFYSSCNLSKKELSERPVARVQELLLYPSDVAQQMPSGVSGEDSVRIARRIIEEWVKDKLLLKKAEQFLSGSNYNIEKQLDNYRASLLTFKYKQEFLLQRIDTVINEKEIVDYYTENSSNYLLNADVVRLTYVKVPSSAPQLSMVRTLFKSEKDEDLARLEQYCLNYADHFIIQSPDWYKFTDFIQQTPLRTDNPGKYLSNTKNIEVKDSDHHYFLHIIDHIPEKKTAPLEMVSGDIRNVLINKRKITLLQELESSVYKEGLSHNQAEIYK